MGQNQAQDEMLTCIWKGFCPTSWLGVSGFFTPAQTWTLGVWVVFTRAMGLPQMKKGGGSGLERRGPTGTQHAHYSQEARHCQRVTMVTGGMWFPQQCRTFPQPSLPFLPISTWNNLFLCVLYTGGQAMAYSEQLFWSVTLWWWRWQWCDCMYLHASV